MKSTTAKGRYIRQKINKNLYEFFAVLPTRYQVYFYFSLPLFYRIVPGVGSAQLSAMSPQTEQKNQPTNPTFIKAVIHLHIINVVITQLRVFLLMISFISISLLLLHASFLIDRSWSSWCYPFTYRQIVSYYY